MVTGAGEGALFIFLLYITLELAPLKLKGIAGEGGLGAPLVWGYYPRNPRPSEIELEVIENRKECRALPKRLEMPWAIFTNFRYEEYELYGATCVKPAPG